MQVRLKLAWPLVCGYALLAGCSRQPPPPPAVASTTAPVADAQTARELELYRKLQQDMSWELAAPIGNEIVTRFAGSAAAREVQETLLDTTTKATAIAARRRLERLWTYQSGKESGGEQNTASIYSNDTAIGKRVRLILRRHSSWGQSVYLFGAGKGFECRGACRLNMHFDDRIEHVKAYLPPTGEPALFISDDAAFIGKLGSTQKISIEIDEKGTGARTLVFDAGGFDPRRFPPLARKK